MDFRYKTSVNVTLGPFVDKSNAASAETGLTPSIAVSKAGANFAARASSRSVAHYQQGWYKTPLNSVDTGTLGRVVVMAAAPNTHLAVWVDGMVLRSAAYDAKYLHPGGSALVSAAVNNALVNHSLDAFSTAVSARARQALVDLDLDHLLRSAAGAGIPHSNSVMDVIMKSTAATTFNRTQHSLKAIRSQGDAAWATGSFATQAHVESARADLASAIAGISAGSGLDSAAISARVQANLINYGLDHLVHTSAPPGMPRSNSVMERIMVSSAGGTFTPASHSLKAIRQRGDAAWDTATGFATQAHVESARAQLASHHPTSAQVSAAVNRVFVNQQIDHLMNNSAPAGVPRSNSTLERIMVSVAAGAFDRAVHSLKAIRQAGDAGDYAGSLTSTALSGTVKHALTDIRLEKLLAASATVATVVRSNSIFNRVMVSGGASVYSQAKGNLRSIWNKAGSTVSGAVSAGDVSNIADEVWQRSRAATGIAPSGSFGEALVFLYGSGSKPVNHDTGGTDNLRIVDQQGAGIGDVRVRVYKATD